MFISCKNYNIIILKKQKPLRIIPEAVFIFSYTRYKLNCKQQFSV